jgi:hypothetical protein
VGQLLLRHPLAVPDASEIGRESLAEVHVPSQPICGLIAHGFKASIGDLGNVTMMDYVLNGPDAITKRLTAAPKTRSCAFAKEARHSRRAPSLGSCRAGRRSQPTVIRVLGMYRNRLSADYFGAKGEWRTTAVRGCEKRGRALRSGPLPPPTGNDSIHDKEDQDQPHQKHRPALRHHVIQGSPK